MKTSRLVRVLLAVTLVVSAVGCNTTHTINRQGSGNSFLRMTTGGFGFEWGSDVDSAPQKQDAKSSYTASHTAVVGPPKP